MRLNDVTFDMSCRIGTTLLSSLFVQKRQTFPFRLPKESPNIEVKLMQDLQGTEMDIVIISCAKTNIDPEKNLLSELTDYWNVAITRATESLYICGNLKTLQRNEVLRDLIRDAHNRQVIRRVSSFFEMSLLYDVLVKSEMKSPNSF